ncbi:MAG: hypothetical protein HY909_15040 [Deltaproteobacteria bacterium]|nr:hypothetical protein [Deltaproteobacteria bacterium]
MGAVLGLAALGLLAPGCETQGLGQRCETQTDCESTAVCRVEFMNDTCSGAGSCVCCPTDPTLAEGYPGCRPSAPPVTDSGARDSAAQDSTAPSDTAVDTAVDTAGADSASGG